VTNSTAEMKVIEVKVSNFEALAEMCRLIEDTLKNLPDVMTYCESDHFEAALHRMYRNRNSFSMWKGRSENAVRINATLVDAAIDTDSYISIKVPEKIPTALVFDFMLSETFAHFMKPGMNDDAKAELADFLVEMVCATTSNYSEREFKRLDPHFVDVEETFRTDAFARSLETFEHHDSGLDDCEPESGRAIEGIVQETGFEEVLEQARPAFEILEIDPSIDPSEQLRIRLECVDADVNTVELRGERRLNFLPCSSQERLTVYMGDHGLPVMDAKFLDILSVLRIDPTNWAEYLISREDRLAKRRAEGLRQDPKQYAAAINTYVDAVKDEVWPLLLAADLVKRIKGHFGVDISLDRLKDEISKLPADPKFKPGVDLLMSVTHMPVDEATSPDPVITTGDLMNLMGMIYHMSGGHGDLVFTSKVSIQDIHKVLNTCFEANEPEKHLRLDGSVHLHDFINGGGSAVPASFDIMIPLKDLRDGKWQVRDDVMSSYGIAGVWGEYSGNGSSIEEIKPLDSSVRERSS